MKSWLFVFTLLVVLCTCIETLKTKHVKRKNKHHQARNETSNENSKVEAKANSKSKGSPLGQFALKLPMKSNYTNVSKTSKASKKKTSEKVSRLLRELRKCMNIHTKSVRCKKGKKKAKKAMIWPKKMLPTLEKMLMNKINGGGNYPGDNNGDNGYENYDNPSDNSYANGFSPTSSTFGKNDFSDNWDSLKLRHNHKAKFHGMEVVPLLRMLKEKLGDSSPFDSNAFTGMPSTQGGAKYLTKLLLSQALGKPDRGAVMKDMMQEFFLANGNERSGEEAREAFNELLGHNNLISANSQMEAENSDVNVAPSQGLPAISGSLERQEMGGRTQGFGAQVVQAQELPNGQIAPINQGGMGQRMMASRTTMQEIMPAAANPTTRMLNSETLQNIQNIQNVVPSMQNVPNVPNVSPNVSPNVPNVFNNVVQNQLAERIAEERVEDSRPVPFAKSDNLIFEEQGESAARGIKPPPFGAAEREYEAERVMKLGPSYQSSPIREPQTPVMSPVPQRLEMAMRDGDENVVGMQGERFGNEVAAFFPGYPEQELADRRDALPSSHKHMTPKAPMRSKDLPKSNSKKNRTLQKQ